jgi:hypothetical protein
MDIQNQMLGKRASDTITLKSPSSNVLKTFVIFVVKMFKSAQLWAARPSWITSLAKDTLQTKKSMAKYEIR